MYDGNISCSLNNKKKYLVLKIRIKQLTALKLNVFHLTNTIIKHAQYLRHNIPFFYIPAAPQYANGIFFN